MQPFLYLFTETINWHGGDDDIDRTFFPLTTEEKTWLLEKNEQLTEADVNALGEKCTTRRSLHSKNKLREGAPVAWWGSGIRIEMHS